MTEAMQANADTSIEALERLAEHHRAVIADLRRKSREDHEAYKRRAAAQEREIRSLYDRLQASHEDQAILAAALRREQEEESDLWHLVPAHVQKNEIEKRIHWEGIPTADPEGCAVRGSVTFRGQTALHQVPVYVGGQWSRILTATSIIRKKLLDDMFRIHGLRDRPGDADRLL